MAGTSGLRSGANGTKLGGDVYNLSDLGTATATVNLFNSILDSSSGTALAQKQSAGNATINPGSPPADLVQSSTIVSGNFNSTGLLTGSAELGTLSNNGGPTKTLAPLVGSVVIDAGNTSEATGLTTDQRGTGFPRLVNGQIDLGAVEHDFAPTITSGATTSFTQGTAGTFTVTTALGNPPETTLSESGDLPAGVTFVDNGDGTATLQGTATVIGTFTLTITASNGITPNAVQTFTLVVNAPPPFFAVGADAGGAPQVVVYNAQTGAMVSSFYAFGPSFTGGVRVAVDEINGSDDIICAAGPGADRR